MQPTKPNHELRDIRFPIVGISIATLLLIVVLGLVTGFGAYQLLQYETPEERQEPEPAMIPPPPRVTPDPARQLEALRAITEQQMTTYGWVDRAQGKVRIPVARALEIIAEQGLPTQAPPANDPPAGERTPE